MKFIGQFIQNFIARFRNDVYLEDVSSGTIASGGNLGLDSNNKIVKANEPTSHDAVTLAGTPDYITLSGQEITRNQIDLANDVTGTLAAGNVATLNQDTTGNAATADALRTLTASGTNAAGASLTLSGGISTGNAEGGSIIFKSNNGGSSGTSANTQQTIATLDSDGNLQIDGTLTTGSGTLALNTTGLIQVANQSNITGVGTLASGNATAIVDAASDTAAGKVELATTAEADTGTDTARAVTPAGLKSHVDARYTYQYIPLSANATTPTDGDWMYASGNGIGNHLYNQNGGAGGTTASNTDGSASTITISKNAISGGIMVPYDSILCGFYAQTRAATDAQKAVGVFTGQPIWNDYIDITAFLRGYSAQDISAGPDSQYNVRAVRHEVLNVNYSLSAGECIWFCLKDLSGSGGGVISSDTRVD